MNSLYFIVILSAIFFVLLGYARYYYFKASNAQKNAEIARKEAKAIAEELENAKKAKKITESNNTLSSDDVDEQLQHKGYFRN